MFLWLKEDKDLETVLPSAATAAETPSVFGLLGQMFRPGNRSVLYAFLGTFLFHSAHAAYQAGVSGFGVFEVNVSAGRVGQLVGVADIVYVLLAFPSGLLANRFGPRPVMMVGMLMYMVVCLSGALFITNEAGFTVVLFAGGIAWALVFVNSLPLIMNTDNGRNFGVFAGLYFFAFQSASIVGPLLSGALVEIAGSQRMMWYVAGGGMLLAFVSLWRVTDQEFDDVGAVFASD